MTIKPESPANFELKEQCTKKKNKEQCTLWMNPESVIQTEVCQKEKTNIIY